MATGEKTGNSDTDFQLPLMNVFRSAFRDRDEMDANEEKSSEDKKVSVRQIERREGTTYDRLKEYFVIDLGNLMSTVHLEAVEDLAAYPNIRKSVLNYGVQDVTSLISNQANLEEVRRRLKDALIDHEPRLIPETVVVKLITQDEGSARQTMAFEVEAVMAARPVDVPLEFIAEIDSVAGKVVASKLTVHE